MNKEYEGFKLDEKTQEELNVRMAIALFKILYDQNQITMKEYKSLVSNACRTFNIKI